MLPPEKQTNILLFIPDKKVQAELTAQLQSVYNIWVADSLKDLEQSVAEKNIQLVICTSSLIINNISCSENHTRQQRDHIGSLKGDEFIKRLQECIADNIHNKVLNVGFLASTLNMSRPTLYRKIKNITNHTPNELIGLNRLKQAALLLTSSNYKVFEVAELVGFNSSSSFCKAFLKQYKVTPVAYKRINRISTMG